MVFIILKLVVFKNVREVMFAYIFKNNQLQTSENQ